MYKAVFTFIKKPAFKIITSLLILAVLLYWLPFAELKETLGKISIISWLLVFAGFIAGHTLGVLKWKLLVNMGKNPLPFLVSVRCYFAGLFANLFLPSLAGGDIVKTGLAIRHNNEKGTTIFGTILDRIIDTGSVVFIIIIAALLSPKFVQPQDQRIIYLIVGIFVAIIFSGILFLAIPADKIENPKIRDVLKRSKEILKLTSKKPSRPVIAFILSLSVQSTFILLTIYLAEICDIHIPLVLWFLVWPLAKLSALLPISLGGIGVREVALAALLSRVAVPLADSVALGLLWESVLVSGGLFGGLLYLLLKHVSSQDIPSLASFSKTNNRINELP